LNLSELIIQLQQGDEAAFKKLVDDYQVLVFNTALGIVQNTDDADDISQEVFIQVFKSVSSFKGDSKFSTWLYRITVGKALDHVKKKKRKKRFGMVQRLFGGIDEDQIPAVEFNHPGVQMEKKQRANELFNALKQIPDNQRIAFTLHKLEGQSYQEVAEIMNTTLYAVESLMSRAKANLKKELKTWYKNMNE
jgi:RNA polymerase sigma-70 factor (ECF subfamily)